jgi:quercetin dioxygenase-like cupin family protein
LRIFRLEKFVSLIDEETDAVCYSISLFVPPGTTIQAHSHRDDRMATVVSGTWHFGYGTHFDEKALKTLPVGSVYSEPGGVNHFVCTAE